MRISDWSSDVCSSDLAFAALDPQQHALAVDIADLQRRYLGDAHPRAIGDRQRRLVLEGAGRIEQPLHLGHGQNDWDLANLLGADQLARTVGEVAGDRELEGKGKRVSVRVYLGRGCPTKT